MPYMVKIRLKAALCVCFRPLAMCWCGGGKTSYMWYATKRTISTGDFKSTHTIETNQHRGISFAFFSYTNTAARSPVKWITFYEKLATGSIALCLLNFELNATFIGDPMSCVIVSQGQLERRIIHLLRLDDERARLRFLMSTTSTI